MTRSERHFLQRPLLCLLVILFRFQRWQRSEAETIQQSNFFWLQDGQPSVGVTSGPSQLHTMPDWFSICGPVTERWVYWAGGCDLQTLPIQEVWNREESSFIVGTVRFLSCWVRCFKPAGNPTPLRFLLQEKSVQFSDYLECFQHFISRFVVIFPVNVGPLHSDKMYNHS